MVKAYAQLVVQDDDAESRRQTQEELPGFVGLVRNRL